MRILCCLLMLCSTLLSGCGDPKEDAVAPIKKLDEAVTLTGDADAPMTDESQDAALAAIRALGGDVKHDNRQVSFRGSKMTDAGLVHLKGLTSLYTLGLCPRITDAGLVHLKGLTSLRELALGDTQVTDAGLVHLKGLTSLKCLVLLNTQVTDAGLEHLKGLTNLRILILETTKVTDAGLVYLKGLTNLNLNGTKVTSAGVKHLQSALPKCEIFK